jgi:thiamine-monophosphate kinase
MLSAAGGRLQLRVPAGDDAAVLEDGTALTADALCEGVHFTATTPPYSVGWKTLAVSVSDLAAMGARPSWALLTLSLPAGPDAWSEAFAQGLGAASQRWGVSLIGGDTTRSTGPRVASLTLGGPLAAHPLTRGGARPGDTLWVTGTLGLAGLGWSAERPPKAALDALHHPVPPLSLALALAEAGLVTAAMDLSDGLAADLPRLCSASGVGAVVDASALPTHEALDGHPEQQALQLGGGEDYALLFSSTADPDVLQRLARLHGEQLTPIGRIVEGREPRLQQGGWPRPLFEHFGEAS